MKILSPNHSQPKSSSLVRNIFIFFLLMLLGVVLWVNIYSAPVPTARMTILACENAQILSKEKMDWIPAIPGALLNPSDILRTGPLGRLDFGTPRLSLRMEENSQINLRPGSRYRPFINLFLDHGYLLVKDEGEKFYISVPLTRTPFMSNNDFISDLFSFFSVTIEQGNLLFNIAPDLSLGAILAYQGTAEVTSLVARKSFTLYEGNKVGFFQGSTSVETTPLTPEEKATLEESFRKVKAPKLSGAPHVKEESSEKTKKAPAILTSEPQSEIPEVSFTQEGTPIALESPLISGTKSGVKEATYEGDVKKGGPFLEFRYEVPNSDSMAELHFNSPSPDLSKFTKLRLQITSTPAEAFPDNLRLEIKSGEKTIRVLNTKLITQRPQILEFPIKLAANAAVSEISIILTNAKVGAAKKGALRIHGLYLIS